MYYPLNLCTCLVISSSHTTFHNSLRSFSYTQSFQFVRPLWVVTPRVVCYSTTHHHQLGIVFWLGSRFSQIFSSLSETKEETAVRTARHFSRSSALYTENDLIFKWKRPQFTWIQNQVAMQAFGIHCIEGMQVDHAIYVTMEQEHWGHSQWP